MDEKTSLDFAKAWTARFPGKEIPHWDSIRDPTKGREGLVNALQTCRNEIERLKAGLDQQEFVATFLWNILHGVSRRSFGQIESIFADDGRTDEEKLELDSPVPVVDFDDTNPTSLLYKEISKGKTQPELNFGGRASQRGSHAESGLTSFGHVRPANVRQSYFGRLREEAEVGYDNRVTSNASVSTVGGSMPGGPGVQNQVGSESLCGPIAQGTDDLRRGHVNLLRRSAGSPGSSRTDSKASSWRPTGDMQAVPQTQSQADRHKDPASVSVWDGAVGVRYQPKIQLGKTLSEPGQAFTPRDSTDRCSQKHRPPVPAPRPSSKGPVFKQCQESSRSGIALLARADSMSSVGSAGSALDSPLPDSSLQPMEKYNVSPSGFRRRKHEYCEIDIASISSKDSLDSSGSAEDPHGDGGSNLMQGNPESDVRKQRQALRRQQDYVNVTIPGQGQAAVVTPEESVSPKVTSGPPMLKRRGKTMLSKTDSESGASVSSRDNIEDDDGTIYDSPIPVNREEVEESSSDEDEPIYWNLMQLKQEMLTKVSMDANAIYASVNLQKKDLERQARRLSQSFPQSPIKPETHSSPPVPKRIAPVAGGSRHRPLKGKCTIGFLTYSAM